MGSKSKHLSTETHQYQNSNTETMNSMIMSSRKALVAKPTQSRRVASKATRRPVRLPPLSDDEISRQIDYLFFAGPALYENRYWTMWKLPMFGCQSGDEVLAEIQNCQDEYPGYRVRVVGFDNVRQCQMAGFIVRI